MKNLLAQADIFGTIAPLPGTPGDPSDPVGGVGTLLGVGLQFLFLFAGLLLMVYLFWGAFDWITSAGEKDRIVKAQGKIINAVIGMVAVIGVFTLFSVINCTILKAKIIDTCTIPWKINVPHV